jgi:hypothetical protein
LVGVQVCRVLLVGLVGLERCELLSLPFSSPSSETNSPVRPLRQVRSFINVSGTDDVPQRLYVLLIMALLLGFSANASAVTIECGHSSPSAEGTGETGVEPTTSTGDGEGEAAPVEHVARFLFRRAEDNFGQAVELGGGCILEEGWAKSVRAALAFFLVAKAVRVGLLIL